MQSKRLEIPIFKSEKPYEVLPAEEGGLFVFRRLYGEEGSDPIEIVKLDTALKEQWRGYLPTDDRYFLASKRVDRNKLFFLLRYRDFSNNNFQLFSIEADSGQFVKYEVRNFIAFTPTEFHVTKTAALMGGYYRDIPVVIYYHFETRKSKILPGLLNEKGELTQVKVYPDDSFDVLISARNYVGQQTVFIKNYDQDGDLQNNFPMEPQDNKHLIFARSMKSRNNTQLVAGVYGARNSVYSRGLFLASIDGAGNQQLRYYGYGDLQNFFKYLRAKREARIKHRVERRKIKGKKIRFNYRFLVHEIVPYKNQFVLLGEAFYPHYTNASSSYGGTFFNPNAIYQGGSLMRDGRVFDGYRYTHAVVMGFDQNGKLLWDNSFEINDVKTFTLEQFVKLEVQQDRIVLLYVFDNELRSKIIKNDMVLEGKSSESILTNDEKDIVKNDQRETTKLEYWYKDYFLVHGVQDISNPETGKRRVFFINKVKYH